jgi:hypothetical protein
LAAKVPINAASASSKMASANVIRWARLGKHDLGEIDSAHSARGWHPSVGYNMANMGVGVIRGQLKTEAASDGSDQPKIP